MSSWKVLIADQLEAVAAELLSAHGVAVDAQPTIEADALLEIIPDYHGLIVRGRTKPNAEMIQAASSLKVIGRAGVGVDNIDLAAAKSAGVAVVNTPQSTTLAVAEHAFALLLALVRKIPQADTAVKAGEWPKRELLGTELAGKTLGIVGVGKIGGLVARRAAAFEMRVLGYDPLLDEQAIRSRHAEPTALDNLYAQSDVISFHLPLTDETRGMVSGPAFITMKSGVRIIQTARGGVIDESALLAALESGHVASAALDVFGQEPPGDIPLIRHPNVIATPHIAAQTAEAQSRAAHDVAEEIINALEGRPLRWQVA
ncbi:MAG: hydroxyacid dehydrogenase [Chloroflexi bacterium]|nr:hydroxyacid dehydrogenase [Chloroflexota bacterium]